MHCLTTTPVSHSLHFNLHYQLRLTLNPASFFHLFPLILHTLPLSNVMQLCQWEGAGWERKNESGSQEAMHLKSPLCHNKKEIDLWLAWAPSPFAKPIWTHKQTHTHTHNNNYWVSLQKRGVHPPFGSTIRFPEQQVRSHRAQHHTCTHWATSHFSTTSSGCSQIYAWLCNTDSHIKSRQWHESNLPGTYNSNLVLSSTSTLTLLLRSVCGEVQENLNKFCWDGSPLTIKMSPYQ